MKQRSVAAAEQPGNVRAAQGIQARALYSTVPAVLVGLE